MQPSVKKPSSSAIEKHGGAHDVPDVALHLSDTDSLPVINESQSDSSMQHHADVSITKKDADSQADFQGAMVCREHQPWRLKEHDLKLQVALLKQTVDI